MPSGIRISAAAMSGLLRSAESMSVADSGSLNRIAAPALEPTMRPIVSSSRTIASRLAADW